MTLFDAASGKKSVDAKEEKIATNTEKSFEANAMFRIVKSAEQDAEEVSTQKDEQSVTAKTK
eukprot:7079542-Karenia_brevis.AAC.1